MSKSQTAQLRHWLDNYADSVQYQKPDQVLENIKVKYNHTLRVADNILEIGQRLALSDEYLDLAEIIALLHDVGRFEQYRKHNTFFDTKSENHALLGIKVLEQEMVLIGLSPPARQIVCTAIRHHNLPVLPSHLKDKELFFSKLIRDADKLDILHVMTNYYETRHLSRNPALEYELLDTDEYSPVLVKDLLAGKFSPIRELKTFNDMKLLQLQWVNDINFAPTFTILRQKGFIDKTLDHLPATEEMQQTRQFLHIVLANKAEN